VNSSAFNARRLDVAALAQAGARLAGEWPGRDFSRLQRDALATDDGAEADAVAWTARGELRTAADGLPRIGLDLQARTRLRLQCQRCLLPMLCELNAHTRLRFAADEATAERLDPDSDDDILALPSVLDLRELVEDELILALPPFPRHDRCDPPGPLSDALTREAEPKPFAALAALRRSSGDGPA